MVALQIISKIIQTSDLSIYEDNLLTPDYFIGYEKEIFFRPPYGKKLFVLPQYLNKINNDKTRVNRTWF